MKYIVMLVFAALLPATLQAQDRIYRCGNEYTNDETWAQERGCRRVEGGNVTVLPAAPVSSKPPLATPSATTTAEGQPSQPAIVPLNPVVRTLLEPDLRDRAKDKFKDMLGSQ